MRYPLQASSSSSATTASLCQNKPVEYAFLYVSSPSTRMNYRGKLKDFFDYLGLPGNDLEQQGQEFLNKVRKEEKEDPYWAQEKIMSFLAKQRERVENKELRPGSLGNFLRPIKKFCDAYDDVADKIKWKRMTRALPRAKPFSNDRAPTIEEIRKIINHSDRRTKAIVYVMCSSGIRLGAWKYIKWKHVKPKFDGKGELLAAAAELLVYDGEGEEYFTFITPEAYRALKDYMDFRAECGEKITGESWLIRDRWRTADMQRDKCGRLGLAKYPRRLKVDAVKKIIERAWLQEGIRPHALPEGERRYEFKGVHGFRKFFQTRAQQAMNLMNVEILMGHSLGIADSYYKPTYEQLFADYLKAVPFLSINYDYDKSALQKQVTELTEKSEEEAYIIEGKLAKKEIEAEETKKKLKELEARQQISDANSKSMLDALMAAQAGVKAKVEIITWHAEDGLEGLFAATEIARAENQKRQKEHQRRHKELQQRYGNIKNNNRI
jgi:site-specific recombinase XerC